jgi:hypothetical protein
MFLNLNINYCSHEILTTNMNTRFQSCEAIQKTKSTPQKKQELLRRGKKYRKKANDQNPLGPCGACMEWLKKIAEREPSFRVVTFDTYDCQNIFVTRINPY